MNLTILGIIIGVLSLIVGIITLFIAFRTRKKKMRFIKAERRLKILEKIFLKPHSYVLNLKTSAFIFMPNGEIIFGAAWANESWMDLLESFVKESNLPKVTVANVGKYFYLTDLITGENLKIPEDPQRGMTLNQNGISIGHMYIFSSYLKQ